MNHLQRAIVAAALWCVPSLAASAVLISDTIKVAPENGLFYGTITVSAPDMRWNGVSYKRWERDYRVEAGVVAITLVPNTTATPLNTRYRITYKPDSNARPWTRQWNVPESAIALKVEDVEEADVTQPAIIPYLNPRQISTTGASSGFCIQYNGTIVTWGSCGTSVWGGITGTLSNQTDLQTALNLKAAASHTHLVADVTGLQTALDGKSATSHTHASLYAALAHVHLVADVTGLQAALDGKSATTHNHTGVYEPIDLTILRSGGSYSDPSWLILSTSKITGLDAALGGKAATSHNHSGVYEPADATIIKSSGSYASPTWLPNTPTVSSGSGAPASTPTKLGDVYIDTDAEGITYIAECATTSGCWREIGSGSAVGLANYSQAFTSQTSVALTHNAGTDSILVQCFDGSGNVLEWNTLAKTDTNTATVTFSVAATGSCVVNASGGGGSGGSGDTTLVANSGAGVAVLKAATNVTAKTLVAGTNVTITDATDTITIASTGGTGTITAGPTLVESPTGTYNVNGAVIPMYLAGTASLTYTAIANGACGNQTFTLAGALNGDSIAAGWPATISAGFSGVMFVSAADTITVRLCNHSGGSVTPTAGLTYKALILRAF